MNSSAGSKIPPQKRIDGEVITAFFLLVLTVFLIFTVSILIFRSCQNETENPPVVTTTPESVIPPPDPTVVSDEIDSYYAVLLDMATGWVVAEKNSNIQFSPASMTKVMTLIVACENLTADDLDRQIPFTYDVAEYVTSGNYAGTGTSLPLESGGISCIGDTYRIKDLLYGIGVASAADCTYMIAKEIAGTEEAFVRMMNAKARELGLSDTSFDNAVGFDSETNLTTACDMAKIMEYALQNELIVDILKPRTSRYTVYAHWDDGGVDKTYAVHFDPSYLSRLEKYPSFSLTGVDLEACKTGYTNESFIVVSAISKTTGTRYILVLGDKDNGTQETITTKLKNTMIDIETMFNTFVP